MARLIDSLRAISRNNRRPSRGFDGRSGRVALIERSSAACPRSWPALDWARNHIDRRHRLGLGTRGAEFADLSGSTRPGSAQLGPAGSVWTKADDWPAAKWPAGGRRRWRPKPFARATSHFSFFTLPPRPTEPSAVEPIGTSPAQ